MSNLFSGQGTEDSNCEDAPSYSLEQIRPAYEQVAAQIRLLLINGDIRPGERLPSEVELTSMFKVGRTSIREGIRLLASENLVLTTRSTEEHSSLPMRTSSADTPKLVSAWS